MKDTLDFYDYTELSPSPSETSASSYCTTFRPSQTLTGEKKEQLLKEAFHLHI